MGIAPDPHCRIGRVRPKLRAVEGNVTVVDPWDDAGFVEDMIAAVRCGSDVKSYTFVAVHEDGSVTRGSTIKSGGFQELIGGLFCEMSALVERTRR